MSQSPVRPALKDRFLETPFPKSYWISHIFCFYTASILSVALIATGYRSVKVSVVILFTGVLIDRIRRLTTPELKISEQERKKRFDLAVTDSSLYAVPAKTFRWISIFLYSFWLLIYGDTICHIQFLKFLNSDSDLLFRVTKIICNEVYPFIRNDSVLFRTFGNAQRVSDIQNLISATWCIMLVLILLNVSGAAFFGLQGLMKTRNPNLKSKKKIGPLYMWVGGLLLLVLFYGLLGSTELNRYGVTDQFAPIGANIPKPYFRFSQIAFETSFALLNVEIWFRFAYSIALAHISDLIITKSPEQ